MDAPLCCIAIAPLSQKHKAFPVTRLQVKLRSLHTCTPFLKPTLSIFLSSAPPFSRPSVLPLPLLVCLLSLALTPRIDPAS